MLNSNRWLVVLGALVLALVVASTAVALLADDEQTFADGTPERAVQQYLQAVADGDTSAARALLTPEAQERCRDWFSGGRVFDDQRDFRATLERTEERGATVIVHVRLTERYGDAPFGGSGSTQTLLFELIQVEGAWRITDAGWPWYCSSSRLPPYTPAPTATATPAR